jgi:hypothetical protein
MYLITDIIKQFSDDELDVFYDIINQMALLRFPVIAALRRCRGTNDPPYAAFSPELMVVKTIKLMREYDRDVDNDEPCIYVESPSEGSCVAEIAKILEPYLWTELRRAVPPRICALADRDRWAETANNIRHVAKLATNIHETVEHGREDDWNWARTLRIWVGALQAEKFRTENDHFLWDLAFCVQLNPQMTFSESGKSWNLNFIYQWLSQDASSPYYLEDVSFNEKTIRNARDRLIDFGKSFGGGAFEIEEIWYDEYSQR